MAGSFLQPVSELCLWEEKQSYVGVHGPFLAPPTLAGVLRKTPYNRIVDILSLMPTVMCGHAYIMCPDLLNLGPQIN